MIQILLHFLILALPKPSSPSSEDKKRKRGRKREELAPNLQENLQETLDILTDRLCIWRETDFAFSDASLGLSATSERDWLQTFCEDVVRPAFKQLLPCTGRSAKSASLKIWLRAIPNQTRIPLFPSHRQIVPPVNRPPNLLREQRPCRLPSLNPISP